MLKGAPLRVLGERWDTTVGLLRSRVASLQEGIDEGRADPWSVLDGRTLLHAYLVVLQDMEAGRVLAWSAIERIEEAAK